MYGTPVHALVRIADMRQVRLGDLYYTGEPIASGYYKGTQKGETGLYHTDMCSQMYMHTHCYRNLPCRTKMPGPFKIKPVEAHY